MQPDQGYPYPHQYSMYKQYFPTQPYSMQQFPAQCYYPFNHYMMRPIPQMQPLVQQPREPILITDSEEEVIVKPPPTPVIIPKKTTKVLDLDTLEEQGRVYDHESSQSTPPQRRVIRETNKKNVRNWKFEPNYDSPKADKKRKPHRTKKTETQRRAAQQFTNHAKDLRIGVAFQARIPEQGNVKTKLIRLYTPGGEQFEQLMELLQQSYPHCNDEDVARVLNIAGKDYAKAQSLVQDSDLLIQYYFETYFSKREQSEEESTNKK